MTDNATRFYLRHPLGLDIHVGLTEAQVAAIPGVRIRDMRTGYVWYGLPESPSAGERISMDLCFADGHLDCLTVVVCDDQRFGSSWSDWSEPKELARTEATRLWLANVGYPVAHYPWGNVYAEFDPKGGVGGGGIRFKPGTRS